MDYLSIVEVPMDLSTVKMKLNNGRYTTIQAVINDLDLIWSNCKTYNRENSV
jgi:histone acetyltransferase